MSDSFASMADTIMSQARRLRAVTPHAANDLPDGVCKALLIGNAGTVAVVAVGDTEAVVLNAAAGQVLPVRARAVRVTGTTATGIVALY